MVVYLSSPGSQMHADYLRGMPVLVSFAGDGPSRWMQDYLPSFRRVLIDSGAFSVFNSGRRVELEPYAEWAAGYPWADAVAALDDVGGDWEQGMANWRAHPWMFPTYHDSDPPEALDAILAHSPPWLGLGMVPPRANRRWLLETLERIPASTHVHGWALRQYADLPRLNSLDSTEWFRTALKLKAQLPWLTPAECCEIVVKRYQRAPRVRATEPSSEQEALDL